MSVISHEQQLLELAVFGHVPNLPPLFDGLRKAGLPEE